MASNAKGDNIFNTHTTVRSGLCEVSYFAHIVVVIVVVVIHHAALTFDKVQAVASFSLGFEPAKSTESTKGLTLNRLSRTIVTSDVQFSEQYDKNRWKGILHVNH